jgi:5'-3' exonuclease
MIDFGPDVFDGNILMIDLSNLAVQTAFAVTYKHPEDNRCWNYWKNRFLSNIIEFVGMFKTDRLILAMDSDNYWRKDIYPEYKLNRHSLKKACKIDLDNFNEFYYNFAESMKSIFSNVIMLRINTTEADDIVAVLTKFHSPDSPIVVMSSDKDYRQLLKYKNVKQYDQLQRKYIQVLNPISELEMKVILGDKGDFIPAIKKGVGPVAAEALLNNGVPLMESSDQELVNGFKRNKVLIDFDFIPQNIQDNIIEGYKKYPILVPSNKKIFDFLSDHSDDAVMKWQAYGEQFLKLR